MNKIPTNKKRSIHMIEEDIDTITCDFILWPIQQKLNLVDSFYLNIKAFQCIISTENIIKDVLER